MDSGGRNEGQGQNQAEIGFRVIESETQQLLPPPLATGHAECESASGAQLDNALTLRDFVTRHTFINLSVADSWKDQLLYAMPINRLGQVAPPGV